MNEKRKFQRIPFQCRTQVKCGDKTLVGELLDISMKGALILLRDTNDLEIGRTCMLDIKLVSSEVHLQFEAELIHRENSYYGFNFIAEDLETFTHLRRLLELNIGDPAKVDRELADLLHP